MILVPNNSQSLIPSIWHRLGISALICRTHQDSKKSDQAIIIFLFIVGVYWMNSACISHIIILNLFAPSLLSLFSLSLLPGFVISSSSTSRRIVHRIIRAPIWIIVIISSLSCWGWVISIRVAVLNETWIIISVPRAASGAHSSALRSQF